MSKKFVGAENLSKSFATFVVKFKWVFVVLFVVLTILCVCLIPKIEVQYDLSSYLPEESDANRAMSLLKEEFDDKGMMYVMVKNLSKDDAVVVQNQLAEIEGVGAVTYVESENYRNGNALYTVTLSDYDSTEEAFETTEKILDCLDDKDAYYTGQSAYSYFTKLETEESIIKIGIVIVVIILIMLIFTSKTYFELMPMILVFGCSIALNMGTNVLFNGISYVSNLVSLVLQLALSLDYSIILLHRFMEERSLADNATDAAVNALSKGVVEILSSSLTTIGGLASLMFMSLPIGVEIGLSLAKSIVASLVAVIFLMPALLVLFDKPLMKSKHKNFVPSVLKPAREVIKGRKIIVPVFIVLIVLSAVGQSYNTYAFNMNGGSKIVVGQEAVQEGGFGTLNSLVVIVPKGDGEQERKMAEFVVSHEQIDSVTGLSCIDIGSQMEGITLPDGVEHIYLTDAMTKDEFKTLASGMLHVSMSENVGDIITSLYDEYCSANGIENSADTEIRVVDLLVYIYEDEEYEWLGNYKAFSGVLENFKGMLGQLVFAKNNLESDAYTRLTFNITAGIESDETFALIADLKENLGNYYDEFYITGESVVCYDMAEFFPQDNMFVSVFTIVFVLIILLFTFRNFGLPIILVLAIQGGIWINFVIPFLAGNSISFIGYLIISAVQMGATIDYAIVLTNRFKTTKHLYVSKFEAMAQAENAVFPTIITSGIILTVTGFTLGIASSGVVAGLGSLLGVGTLTSMLVVLFVVPSLLLLTDKITDKMDIIPCVKKLFGKEATSTAPMCLYDEEYVRKTHERTIEENACKISEKDVNED